jgi:hypothetical protein
LHHSGEELVVVDVAADIVVVFEPFIDVDLSVLCFPTVFHHILSLESVKELTENLVFSALS